MTFRDATLEDLPKIVEIYNSTVASRLVTADLEPVSIDSKINWFHQHNSEFRPLWIVLDSDKNMVGWVSFQDFYGRPAYQKTAEISIYIDEKYRGKGLGRLILEYAIEKSQDLGIENLLAFIFSHNLPSLNLFEKFGFELWANLKNIAELDGEKRSLIILGKNIKD
ncbi:GNAT family N-acetyltransferase [Epilithonimonas pallida]|uniref:Phosphinothricin acetyltransferase n=1 Tax=Epilithonimonas pallida TaxID=373671 RepID=A0ABY1R2G6_9FLAO|nr:GNAT family N-acetyltransferase [Epilithonimonas pallida]SMP93286.1 phosphinothricin acetyltransferase [Epilithonimonas pallida]